MKNYVTYKRKEINDHFYADPNTDNAVSEQTGGQITFHETPYESDGVFISWIEFDGRRINPTELEYFRTLDPAFDFKMVVESDIKDLLEKAYDGKITVDDYVFTDNRSVDLI